MYKKFILLAFSAVLISLSSCKTKDKADGEAEAVEPVGVATPLVEDVTLTQSFPGHLEAKRKVDIVAQVNGRLHSHAASGSEVKKGQLLYTIENSKYEDAVSEAKANIDNYTSQYNYYKDLYEKRKEAYEKQAASEIEMNEAKSQMEQNLAMMKNAEAALSEAQTMLGYCEIRAPFDGVLSMQLFDDDTQINGEASPVTINTIYNDKIIYALISVDAGLYNQMIADRRNDGVTLDSVKLNFDVPLQHEYVSHIDYEAPDVSEETGTVTMRFAINNDYEELKSGMYVKVVFPYHVTDKALLVRDASIGTDQLGKYLYLVNDSNKVVYTPIEVGEVYNDTMRIVSKGITPESRYVTDALLKVRDGMTVKPVESH